MVMAKALVDKDAAENLGYDPEKGHRLPEIPLHKARQIMTRADFIQSYDAINVFTIDSRAMVRADSVPMMVAFREICALEGFDEYLEATLDRISAIESLGRTRELTIKDLWDNGKYRITTKDAKGMIEKMINFEVEEKEEEKDKEEEKEKEEEEQEKENEEKEKEDPDDRALRAMRGFETCLYRENGQ